MQEPIQTHFDFFEQVHDVARYRNSDERIKERLKQEKNLHSLLRNLKDDNGKVLLAKW